MMIPVVILVLASSTQILAVRYFIVLLVATLLASRIHVLGGGNKIGLNHAVTYEKFS